MKTIKLFFIAVLAMAFTATTFVQAQNSSKPGTSGLKSETIKVWGNCGMCKTRIEKAAKIDGVSKADWNKETKMLTLAYDPSKVKSDDVQKKIASVGHDTEKFKADDKAYSKLDACCQYERKK